MRDFALACWEPADLVLRQQAFIESLVEADDSGGKTKAGQTIRNYMTTLPYHAQAIIAPGEPLSENTLAKRLLLHKVRTHMVLA